MPSSITTKFYISLPASVAEELYNLGEFYRVGPETLAGRLLAGVLQPLAAAASERGEIFYGQEAEHRLEADRTTYLFRVEIICALGAPEDSCSLDTRCPHNGTWWEQAPYVYRCNGCGLLFSLPFNSQSMLPYAAQKEHGSPAV